MQIPSPVLSTVSAPASSRRAPDASLTSFLQAANESERTSALERLFREQVDPALSAVLPFHGPASSDDAQDVRAETVAHFFLRLERARNEEGTASIGDLSSYVKVAARHNCYHHHRQRLRTINESSLPQPKGEDGQDPVTLDLLPDARVNVAGSVHLRLTLRAVWEEITLLPAMQRAALLLNLRDPSGANALPLFWLCGVAGPAEVAAALGLGPEELAGLCEQLPLDDNALAARLGLTRRAVISLRLSARRRLTRRTDIRF